MNSALLKLHFTIVNPQKIFMTAYGGDDRPLPAQRALEAAPAVKDPQ
jgi:hypothetical protein